ncbi:CPBP family intramembrane metalloprotease [Haloarcula sp. S1AR25-5A]|uniref:CPBP family intramembrane metalloprotease n=1 Tax=Haloarcula terrestris TaxID=2950533 RepID=A0AAE4JJY6_9EURY|nr:CPBP family intramembrane glutamic endopeptidase [Haloarcula terrestris]MDS0222456.1 CPBP family intramembrane metalloprotease [Haloarcula terrestris]
MNKLRALSWGGGGLVVLLALWAALHYDGPLLRFAPAVLVGIVAAGLPFGLAYSKSAIESLRLRLADTDEGFSAEQGSVFVSTSAVDDSIDFLEAVHSALRSDEEYDSVERDSFEEGPGLTVLHGGFHNSFIRVTAAGRVVVTGASERTKLLADTVSDTYSLSFERTRNNPFDGMEPVRGAPRVFLGALVFTLLLFGTHAVTATAYPTDTYNPAERAVMVGFDASGSVDPRVSETDSELSKAAFLVEVVNESATEVRWRGNDTEQIAEHGENALAASDDARSLLASAEDESLTPAQVERAKRIRAQLVAAERNVATALEERADTEALENTDSLTRLSDQLRASANRTEYS